MRALLKAISWSKFAGLSPVASGKTKSPDGGAKPGLVHERGLAVTEDFSRLAVAKAGVLQFLKHFVENFCLIKPRCHALAIKGVEADDGIAEGREASWEIRHLLKVVPQI